MISVHMSVKETEQLGCLLHNKNKNSKGKKLCCIVFVALYHLSLFLCVCVCVCLLVFDVFVVPFVWFYLHIYIPCIITLLLTVVSETRK